MIELTDFWVNSLKQTLLFIGFYLCTLEHIFVWNSDFFSVLLFWILSMLGRFRIFFWPNVFTFYTDVLCQLLQFYATYLTIFCFTSLRCSWILRMWPVSLLYFLPQLHVMWYMQFLSCSTMCVVFLEIDVGVLMNHSWDLFWCYMNNMSFVSFRLGPSHVLNWLRLLSECCYQIVPFLPILWGLLSCTQSSCYVVGYCLYEPFLFHMAFSRQYDFCKML